MKHPVEQGDRGPGKCFGKNFCSAKSWTYPGKLNFVLANWKIVLEKVMEIHAVRAQKCNKMSQTRCRARNHFPPLLA